MSPSEVITELYIMPEDAAFGAFSFSLKTLFFHYKGGKMSSSLSHFEAAGLGGVPGPATAVPTGLGDPMGGRRDWKGQPRRRAGERAVCPWLWLGPPPLAWPQRLLFLTLDSPS